MHIDFDIRYMEILKLKIFIMKLFYIYIIYQIVHQVVQMIHHQHMSYN